MRLHANLPMEIAFEPVLRRWRQGVNVKRAEKSGIGDGRETREWAGKARE